MKSILEEGSSIFEAIEKGWKKAGKPVKFTVKILEEPKRNFFGLTTRSAKVGIFFDEYFDQTSDSTVVKEELIVPKGAQKIETKKGPSVSKEVGISDGQAKRAPWSEQMIQDVEKFLKNTFNILNIPNVNFRIDSKHLFLRINFENTIFADVSRERKLFSSLSTLMLQMLKNKYRRPLKGYKILLIGAHKK